MYACDPLAIKARHAKDQCACQILNTLENKYSLLNGNEMLIDRQTDGRTHRWPAGKHDIPHTLRYGGVQKVCSVPFRKIPIYRGD